MQFCSSMSVLGSFDGAVESIGHHWVPVAANFVERQAGSQVLGSSVTVMGSGDDKVVADFRGDGVCAAVSGFVTEIVWVLVASFMVSNACVAFADCMFEVVSVVTVDFRGNGACAVVAGLLTESVWMCLCSICLCHG